MRAIRPRPAFIHMRARSLTSFRRVTPSYAQIPRDIEDLLDEYCAQPQTPASLQMLMRTGRGDFLGKTNNLRQPYYSQRPGGLGHRIAKQNILRQVASFVRQEMPVRLARRIRDLDQVPLMRDMPSVQEVKGIYMNSFLEMLDAPEIHTPVQEEQFALLLFNLYEKHSSVLVKMARGAYELRQDLREGRLEGASDDLEFSAMTETQAFLERFYTSRIGIRVIAGQYLQLRDEDLGEDYIGMICLKTSPSDVVRQAADHATRLCRTTYGRAPRVDIVGRLDLTFAYIPTYLHYICLELLKNALRATAESHADAATLPAVTVVIADGKENEDVVIKVADEGGGIPRSQVGKIFSYLFTTASPSVQESFIGKHDHDNTSPIAGLGYGLPISRAYCRYFGGDLSIISMEKYGTDAFIHLSRLGDSKEPLPL